MFLLCFFWLPAFFLFLFPKTEASFSGLFQATFDILWKWKSLSFVWLCDPMDCSPPGSSVHGILQTRILEWVTIPFSRGSFQPRNWTQVSHIAGGFFTVWATGKSYLSHSIDKLWFWCHLHHSLIGTLPFSLVFPAQTRLFNRFMVSDTLFLLHPHLNFFTWHILHIFSTTAQISSSPESLLHWLFQ